MSGWQIGDLAVCVDASHWPGTAGAAALILRQGSIYRVASPAHGREWIGGYIDAGLIVEGAPNPKSTDGSWPQRRFRKIRPDAHEGNVEDWRDLVEFFTKRVNA